jgi:uncharacterized protein (DUF3084 family)
MRTLVDTASKMLAAAVDAAASDAQHFIVIRLTTTTTTPSTSSSCSKSDIPRSSDRLSLSATARANLSTVPFPILYQFDSVEYCCTTIPSAFRFNWLHQLTETITHHGT